jgi:REP element-mobilizing transposase RayT
MTAPRRVLPGTTYFVTRRCAQRELLLRPSPTTNAVFAYVLALAASRFEIQVHAFCVMSNHWHAVVTDPYARLPAFAQYLGSLVARALNASLRRSEAFWGAPSVSAVVLAEPADVVDKTAYVLANPVAAGLVRSGRDWPGLWSSPERFGAGPVRVKRPPIFFREGHMPEETTLALTPPPGFASGAVFRSAVEEALAVLEASAREQLASEGRGFMGPARVLAQRTSARPARASPGGGINPRVAARDPETRVGLLAALKEFLARYRAALRARRAGASDALFPAGTYLLRVAHGVRCEACG